MSQYYTDIEELDAIQQLRKYLGQVHSACWAPAVVFSVFHVATWVTCSPYLVHVDLLTIPMYVIA